MKPIVLMAVLLTAGCGTGARKLPPDGSPPATASVPMDVSPAVDISTSDNLLPYVGQLVLVTGVVTHSKCPQIHGVDLWSLGDLAGQRISVTGLLATYVITQTNVDDFNRERIAHRGAGRFFEIKTPTVLVSK